MRLGGCQGLGGGHGLGLGDRLGLHDRLGSCDGLGPYDRLGRSERFGLYDRLGRGERLGLIRRRFDPVRPIPLGNVYRSGRGRLGASVRAVELARRLDSSAGIHEDVLGQAQLRHVVEVGSVALGGRHDRADRQDLALDALDRQRQPPTLRIDLEDLDADRVSGLDDLARVLDVVLSQFGDVHEPLDAVEDLHKRPEGDHLGDVALELVADVVSVDDALPGILLGLLEAQRDALTLTVDVEHLDADRVADREDLGRMVDVRPGQLGDVNQAVDPVEVDERAEVDDVGDRALDHLARLEPVEDPFAILLALLLEHGPTGQHHIVAGPIELDHLAFDRLAHVLIEVRHAPDVHQRGGEETPDAQVNDQTALDDFDHGTFDGLARFSGGFDPPPGFLEAGTLLGQDQPSVLILLGQDECVDLLAELDLIAGVHRLADRELAGGDDPLGLVADVDEHLVVIDADDIAGDDVPLLEGMHRGVVVGNDLTVNLQQKPIRAFDDLHVRLVSGRNQSCSRGHVPAG